MSSVYVTRTCCVLPNQVREHELLVIHVCEFCGTPNWTFWFMKSRYSSPYWQSNRNMSCIKKWMSWPKRGKVKIIEKIVILFPPHFSNLPKIWKNDWNDYKYELDRVKPRNWIAAKWDLFRSFSLLRSTNKYRSPSLIVEIRWWTTTLGWRKIRVIVYFVWLNNLNQLWPFRFV
jgi:hypothetical protein